MMSGNKEEAPRRATVVEIKGPDAKTGRAVRLEWDGRTYFVPLGTAAGPCALGPEDGVRVVREHGDVVVSTDAARATAQYVQGRYAFERALAPILKKLGGSTDPPASQMLLSSFVREFAA
jgi:hypothetical protein